jgi:hypothetical protein
MSPVTGFKGLIPKLIDLKATVAQISALAGTCDGTRGVDPVIAAQIIQHQNAIIELLQSLRGTFNKISNPVGLMDTVDNLCWYLDNFCTSISDAEQNQTLVLWNTVIANAAYIDYLLCEIQAQQ